MTISPMDNIHCVFIDEAQFLTSYQVYELLAISLHIPVLAYHMRHGLIIRYGLRTNSMGYPFAGSAHLLAVAHELCEIKTICHCGKKATMNLRLDQNGLRVVGKQPIKDLLSKYKSVCVYHFYND
jgi:thymidine kinase